MVAERLVVPMLVVMAVAASKLDEYLLPKNLVPSRYELRLAPYLDDGSFTFDGEVTIRVTVANATSVVTLHRNDTEFDESSVRVRSVRTGLELEVMGQEFDLEHHFHHIRLDGVMELGEEYNVSLKYSGHLRDDMQGFFRSSYVDSSGETRWLAATHFQPCRARRAFPSLDEPALKARFKVSIARTEDRRALSNMPVVGVSAPDPNVGGMVWDEFAETPMPLSTYLMAFVVSDFANLTVDGRLSLWQRADAVSQARYGASVSVAALRALEDCTGLSFFLPKMDEAAVPDYQSGATEQWGLVTYRERLILYVEGVSTSSHKQATALVIAHEFTHMWFGNLVSPKWWSYLWLSEGFAQYFQYFILAELEAGWRLEEQFVLACVRTAMSADASNSSHPMTVDVADPVEISAIFDTISYQKAASVIRMMKHFVSPQTFRKGLTRYLMAVGNSSAEPDDLFAAMDAQLHEDGGDDGISVKQVMDTWTLQMGYPVLNVARDYDGGGVTVSQERFLLQPAANGSDMHDYTWWIPLTYTTKVELDFHSTATKAWLEGGVNRKTLPGLRVNLTDWIIFNVQQIGFYRVNYDERNWRMLSAQLNSEAMDLIPPLNRAQLIDDALNLARVGALNYSLALDMVRYLERETDYVPWSAALSALTFIEKRMRGADDYDYNAFKEFMLRLLDKAHSALGFDERDSDDHVTKLNRNLVLTWVCRLDEWTCVSRSTELFAAHMHDPENNRIAPDLKTVVYCTALRYGGEAEWQFLWEKFLSHYNVSTEQTLILGVLGCTNNETLAHRFMLSSLSNTSMIRQQDQSLVFPSVYNAHELGVDHAISFLARYYTNIRDYHNSIGAVTSLLSTLASLVTRQDQLIKLQQFVKSTGSHLGSSAHLSLRPAEDNFAWLSERGPAVARFARRQRRRLPSALTPETYRLAVRPRFSSFDGEVTATVLARRPADRVTVHVHDLAVDAAGTRVLDLSSGEQVGVLEVSLDQEQQLCDVRLDRRLIVGARYELGLRYVGHMRDDLAGLYRSHYEASGENRWIATTQFHPTHARKAMPCFDEPALKARFQVSIQRPEHLTSVSNARLNYSTTEGADNGSMWDHYEWTPPMSTYLVAFAVTDFERLSDEAGNLSVWVRPEARQQAGYALSVSGDLLKAVELFAGSGYQLPKMDQLAVPDFYFGAMENWGLVTYRERGLLFDEAVSSTADRQAVATVVAHEFSHQWFGNLVTMSWWTYPWLNEGFATYCQYFVAAKVMTDWRLEQQFVVHVLQNALSVDASAASRPMNHDVDTPAEVASLFDAITYDKASAVIRMMEHFLTTEVFQSGLRRYLQERSYDVAAPDDLYRPLQARLNDSGAPHVDVKAVMDTWTNQGGYPVLTVTRDYEAGTASVKQERFLLRPSSANQDTQQSKWWVPLTVTSRTGADFQSTAPSSWLAPSDDQLVLAGVVSSQDWILLNIQQTGYYRVNYDAANWQLLRAHLLHGPSHEDVHELNRAQLLDDALNLARAGRLDYGTALGLTSYLSREDDYAPWQSALSAFRFLHDRLRGAPAGEHSLFKNYVLKLLGPLYESLGFEVKPTDSHITKLLRRDILSWACRLDHDECVNKSVSLYAGLMADPDNMVAADVASTVYCTALRKGGEQEWLFLWDRYSASQVSSEKVALLAALGCSADQAVIYRYLGLSITEGAGIRKQDAAGVFSAVYDNEAGLDPALDFLIANHENISEFYGGVSSIGSVIAGIAGKISTRQQAEKLERFIDSNAAGLGDWESSTRSALETLEDNMAWLDRHAGSVVTWLTEEAYPAQNLTTEPSTGGSEQLSPHFALYICTCVFSHLMCRI